jgi:hypothetical protein
MDYYKGRSSMSGYGLGSWFAKLFRSAIPLAKKYIAPVAADFASSTLHDWGDGTDLKKSVSQNLRSSARSLGEQLKSRQSGKGLKRIRKTSSLISLNSARKLKASKKKVKIVRSKRDFFS